MGIPQCVGVALGSGAFCLTDVIYGAVKETGAFLILVALSPLAVGPLDFCWLSSGASTL